MSRSSRLIICQRTILHVSLYVVCKLYVSQYAKATQTIHCEVSNESWELDFSWSKQKMKWNEPGFRPPLCTYEPPEDGEIIEMTLSSRHRIRNSSPGGLRPSTLPLGHGGSPQYWFSHVDGEEKCLFLSNRRDREPNPELWRERQRC